MLPKSRTKVKSNRKKVINNAQLLNHLQKCCNQHTCITFCTFFVYRIHAEGTKWFNKQTQPHTSMLFKAAEWRLP